MATNLYFNNYASSNEQNLVEDLIIESIQVHGVETFYMPRTWNAEDSILNEDDLLSFEAAHQLEMYVKNVEGFEGEGDILSRIGLEIRDSMTLTVAVRRFDLEVGQVSNQERPNEGDLVYFPLNRKIFEIKHVEHESVFYQLGDLQVYDLRMELFEYSGERFSTGNPSIDGMYTSIDITSNTAIANVETVDSFADNIQIQQEADALIDFTEVDPFSEGGAY